MREFKQDRERSQLDKEERKDEKRGRSPLKHCKKKVPVGVRSVFGNVVTFTFCFVHSFPVAKAPLSSPCSKSFIFSRVEGSVSIYTSILSLLICISLILVRSKEGKSGIYALCMSIWLRFSLPFLCTPSFLSPNK